MTTQTSKTPNESRTVATKVAKRKRKLNRLLLSSLLFSQRIEFSGPLRAGAMLTLLFVYGPLPPESFDKTTFFHKSMPSNLMQIDLNSLKEPSSYKTSYMCCLHGSMNASSSIMLSSAFFMSQALEYWLLELTCLKSNSGSIDPGGGVTNKQVLT
ncbi:hypothetical protein NC652_036184 [Populus alba x Populus x berolinensis]|nr:hypothetical protein NC652_036184 [Populus alba x Populus x berolinensis]